jgi:hypothetical protein
VQLLRCTFVGAMGCSYDKLEVKQGKKMKHKHYDMIVAWAEGKTIQVKAHNLVWEDREKPLWAADREYRIKPEPKPDIVQERCIASWTGISTNLCPNIRVVFDGETGELKSAEVLK